MGDAPDFIPDGQFPTDQTAAPSANPVAGASGTPDFIPDSQFQADEDKYAGAGQTAKAALEGVSRGLIGPSATAAVERYGFQVPKADIRGRAEAHPIAQGAGEIAGLGAGALTGTGEAAVLGKAGEADAGLAGLAEAGKGASYATRVGSALVKQAAEMAVLQGDNEAAKAIVNDPKVSSESALANIGLAAALGGAGGALGAGVVSPLWKATAGPKVEEFLSGLTNHLNGGGLQMPEAVNSAVADLGIEADPVIKAALSGDPKALSMAQDLYRGQNDKFMAHINGLPKAAQESVAQSLGMPLEDIATFSKADAGREARDTFINEMDKKYGPIAKKLEKRDAQAAAIGVPDEDRRNFGAQIMEHAVGPKGPGTNSDYYNIYEKYAQRVMGEDTIGGLDRLKTELAKKNSLDGNEKQAWQQIRSMIGEFQEQQINKSAHHAMAEGVNRGAKLAGDIVAERQATNAEYANYRKLMEELNTHTGMGDFRGTGTLKSKLNEKLSPEDFVNKFSPKGNAESIDFLAKNFPETAAKVQEIESKRFLSPHIKTNQGNFEINYKTLNNAVEKAMKGSPEYAKYVLPNDSLSKIQSAKVLEDALHAVKGIKDSGTAGNLARVFRHMGASSIGAIGYLMGHNPIGSTIIGEAMQRMGKDAPEAVKLSLLKYMGSDKPIKAEGVKAMADFIHNSLKGEQRISNAVGAVFGSGARIVAKDSAPFEKDKEKIDKAVVKLGDDSQEITKLAQSDIGHYMPDHQTALSQTMGTQLQYLQQLKPKEYSNGPLDKPVKPSPAQEARYQRAVGIAADPTVVLKNLKEGKLQSSDLVDLKTMYPSLYNQMAQKLTNQMTIAHSKGETINYKTRMGLSLFLGQPIDSTMTPQAIVGAQPLPKAGPQAPQTSNGKTRKGTSTLGKSNKSYQTSTQSAESDRAGRD